MSTLRPENRALFKAARQTLAPTREDEARIGKALGLGVAVGVATTTTTTAAATTASTGAVTSTTVAGAGSVAAAKWIGVLVVALGMGAGGVIVRRSTDSRVPVVGTVAGGVALPPAGDSGASPAPLIKAVAPQSMATPVTAPSVAASVGPPPRLFPNAVSRPVGSFTDEPVSAASPSMPTLTEPEVSVAEEARLLREAVAAHRRGDIERASTLLDAHTRAFPNGVLAEERDAERVGVLCARGDLAGADAARARFLESHADSPLAARVRAACGAP
jgi:hypothetical protein